MTYKILLTARRRHRPRSDGPRRAACSAGISQNRNLAFETEDALVGGIAL